MGASVAASSASATQNKIVTCKEGIDCLSSVHHTAPHLLEVKVEKAVSAKVFLAAEELEVSDSSRDAIHGVLLVQLRQGSHSLVVVKLEEAAKVLLNVFVVKL